MPVTGIECPCSGTREKFTTCLERHKNYECSCHVPIYMLEYYANDRRSTTRREANSFSATGLLRCPLSFHLEQDNDVYMSAHSLWNMVRGSWTHHMMESGEDRPEIMREVKLVKYIDIDGVQVRISGTPDEVNIERGILVDYKSKYNLPKGPDAGHEAQFNIYVWLLAGGTTTNGETVNVTINSGGMHYVTWNTKPDKQFEKIPMNVWSLDETEEFVRNRAALFLSDSPTCAPYGMSPYWKCDCQKIQEAINDDLFGGL